jgi:hypothetical protein
VQAQAVSASAINLTWNARSGATGYVVRRNGVSIGTPSANSFGDTGLSASTSYTYTVATVAATGEGPPSAGVQGTTLAAPDTTAPTAPVITAAATGQNTISVALTTPATDSQSGVASYDLEYKTAAASTYTAITGLTAGQFPNVIGSLTAATTYNTRARARDGVGNVGPYSAVSNATTQAAAAGSTYQLPAARRTAWNPGILGGIPPDNADAATRLDGVGPAIQHGSTIAAGASTAAIQAALNAAGAVASKASRRFVQLGAGTFNIGSLSIPSFVILRGTLGANNARQTILRQTNGPASFIQISGQQVINWGSIVKASGTQFKGASTIGVANASTFNVGDILVIDHLSDGSENGPTDRNFIRNDTNVSGRYIAWNSGIFYQRQSHAAMGYTWDGHPDSPGGFRHISQRVEVLAKSGNTLTIYDPATGRGAPLHMTYYNDPEVYRMGGQNNSVVQYAGIENVAIHPAGIDGKESVIIQQAAHCWAKNIESNGDPAQTGLTWSGTHIQLYWHTYRCEFEGCYVHHSSNYSPGGNAYGILWSGSENHIHNNVAVHCNKPMFAESSNGGNVCAYNYTDASVNAPSPSFSETGICTHASFSNYDLFEGNHTTNISIDSTHGNNDKEVIFRNHCRGENSIGQLGAGYARGISSDGWNWDVSSIGNVLWHPGRTGDAIDVVIAAGTPNAYPARSVYLIGSNCWTIPGGAEPGAAQSADDGMALENFLRHGDYDYKTQAQFFIPGESQALPPSMYRTTAPSYFAGFTWPPFNPAGANDAQRIGVLPAKARFDGGTA